MFSYITRVSNSHLRIKYDHTNSEFCIFNIKIVFSLKMKCVPRATTSGENMELLFSFKRARFFVSKYVQMVFIEPSNARHYVRQYLLNRTESVQKRFKSDPHSSRWAARSGSGLSAAIFHPSVSDETPRKLPNE